MTHLKRKLMMTLALLLTAATGAWAESKPIGLNVEYAVGDVITSTTDVYVYYGEHPTNSKQMVVKITSTQPLTISMIDAHSIGLNSDAAVYYLPDGEATGGYAGFIPCVGESTGDATVVHVASGSGTLTEPYVFAPGPFGTPVPLTRGTGEKINEWTLTNGMPAGNVTVSVDYFPKATADGAVTAATDVKATTEDALVTIDETKLTGVAKLMYYVSTDAEATAPDYNAEGWTDQVPTAANYTEAGKVNVWYYAVGADNEDPDKTYSNGDICAAALTVTLGDAPLWNAEFDLTNAPEEDKAPGVWKTDITGEGVKKGTPVTVTYTGTKKVIGVKAEKKATKLTITIPATENAAALTLDVTGCTTWEQILDQNVTTLDYEGDGVYGQTSNCYILDGNNNRLNLNTPYDPTTNYHWGTQR